MVGDAVEGVGEGPTAACEAVTAEIWREAGHALRVGVRKKWAAVVGAGEPVGGGDEVGGALDLAGGGRFVEREADEGVREWFVQERDEPAVGGLIVERCPRGGGSGERRRGGHCGRPSDVDPREVAGWVSSELRAPMWVRLRRCGCGRA